MHKKSINFSSRLAVAKKISIKALDFEKLPRKFSGINYAGNTFLNITRSSSNRGGKDNLTSSLSKQKGKIFFAKPLTSRSRNENAIKLNVIPKTTATVINITPGQKAHPINKPKPFNKLFTHSLYVSYNNSSSTYKTFNTNNQQQTIGGTQKTLSILNKMGDSKSNSRNQSKVNNLVNNSTFSVFMNSKDSMNITSGTIEKIKKISNLGGTGKSGETVSLTKSTLSNHNNSSSNSKGFKNTIKHFSNGNLSSLSHKKLGIKVKKKAIKSNDENDINNRRKINRLFQLPLFQNFNKLKILILWRYYIQRNSYEFKYLPVFELVDNKIIKNYYNNGIIKKYNTIHKEELIWKNYPVPEEYFDIDEKNKDELLLNLYEKALNTYKNLFFCNSKALSSMSLYIFELMTNKLYLNLKKVRFIMKYYYDQEKKAIIKKPSVTVIKEILMKLNKIIERPNIKNKIAQEFIIHNTKIIGNLNLNKSQVKPIISQYLELYKGNKTISSDNFKDNFVYGNIINDFRALQLKKNGYIYKDIINELKDLEDEIIYSYMNEEDLDIILYKIQPIKYNLNIIEQKILSLKNNTNINNYIEGNKEKTKNKIEEIIEIINKLKERLELLSNIIENKYGELSINDKLNDIKFIISYIEFLLIKNNIVYNYENEIKGIDILIEQNNSQRNKKIFDVYNKFCKDNKTINFDYIHFLIIYDKLISLLKNNNNHTNNNKIDNKYNDLKYYNKVISYKDEFIRLYNKLITKSQSGEKNLFFNNEINGIYSMYNEINKYKNYFENIKDEIIGLINTEQKENNKEINYELFYKDIISQYIKYDKDKENNDNNNNNPKKETNLIEKILFKHISTIKNNEENYLNNISKDNNQIKTLNDYSKISKSIEEYYYNKNNRDPKVLNKVYDELKSKNYFNKSSTSTQESAAQYPKLYFLSEQKREKILKNNKISLNDIIKYYGKVNQRQELEVNINHHNKNIITGIKLLSNSKKEFEIFKFNTPITIPSFNNKIKNSITFMSNMYKNIDKEIESSLIQQLLQSLSTFSKKNFHTWVNTTFNQIAICTLCLIFTNEISNLLADDKFKEKMPLKEYNLINQKYNQWLTEECSSITDSINRSNILLTIISQMNIIDSLIKNNVYDINSFNWLKYIRHLWDKSKKDVIIECGGWGNYQMKQLVPYKSRLLLSPDTDKVFLFNSSCFREKSASIIKVINNKYNNVSYKEIFEEYCSLFWTNMISVDATTTPNFELKRIFDVCTIDRSWIFIDNLDLYNTNSNDNINNLIYFSKFIQTIQQEVILNDIKFNDGEKMFCIMGCLNVDDDIKKKCEYLKGSSRLLNFIKPDIDFYIRTTFKLYNNQEIKNINLKKNIDSLLKYEQIIRNKLNGFYFDYDFYNEYINYLVDALPKNNFYEKDKKDNIEINYEDLFTNFLKYYSDKFLSSPNNTQTSINENIFINYFNEKNIIYNKEIIELFKYLYFYANEKLIKRNIILRGYGRHFIIDNFKSFYQAQTNKNFEDNKNLSIIYDNEDEANANKKSDDISKIFDLPSPKNKKLLKIYLDNFNQRLKRLNYTIPDELKLTSLEYIHKVLKANSNNVVYYKLVCYFNNWLTKFLNYIETKKKAINNNYIFNIITECLLLTLGHEKGRIKLIIEIANEVISSQISKQLIQITNKYSYFYYDLNSNNYKTFNNYIDYIKNIKNYLQALLPKTKLEYVISEHFGNNIKNPKNDLSFIYDNEKYIITDDVKSQYIKLIKDNKYNENNTNDTLKVFIGYNDMFDDHKYQSLYSNEKIKEFISKIDKKNINKFLYLLSFFDINNLSIHEIIFIYNSINKNSKEVYDIKYIQNPLNMVKTIYKALPKANYYLKLESNNLLKFLFENKIFKGTNIYFTETVISKSNNVYLDLSQNEIKIKLINEIMKDLIENKKLTFSLLYKLKNNIKNNDDEENINEYSKKLNNYIDEKELLFISNMLNDIYSIQSEEIFREKYPNNTKNYDIFLKIFNIFEINQSKNGINDNYYNSRLLIHYLKYKDIKEDSLKFKTLTSLGTIFNNKTSKINEISILINNTLTNYKELISNKDEYINSKYYYFNSMKISYILNENLYNSTLEKIYLSVSNHFLFSLLLTFEIMVNNFEISVFEKNYALDYIKSFYVFPSDNVIKFKYENETDSFKTSFINDNGKKLIEFYTKKSKSIDNKYLSLLNNSLNSHNNKYFYTTSIKKIPRDIDKLLYYITFIPDQSSSIFKYLINKYLLKILNLSRFNINVALRKVTTKQNMQPITVKAFPSINITNFLCSLSAYFEINFYIVRDGDLFKNEKKGNINYGYKYLIDCDLISLIKEGMKKGYWILICEKIDIIKFMKIMWELNNDNSITPHENFKLFFDEKLILNDCKKAIEDLTMIINIDNENVDDLEAAHDIWVNVLEEKLLTDSIMNQTQKDVLDIVDNGTSGDKTNVLDYTINNTVDNRTNVISATNNSIVSIKSIYNNTTVGGGSNNNKLHDLSGLSNWTFLANV